MEQSAIDDRVGVTSTFKLVVYGKFFMCGCSSGSGNEVWMLQNYSFFAFRKTKPAKS